MSDRDCTKEASRNRYRQLHPFKDKVCLGCQAAFRPIKSNRQEYCVGCLSVTELKTLTCACGVEFKQNNAVQKYCSRKCTDKASKDNGKDQIAECHLCGTPFAFKEGHNQQGVFCSRACVGLSIRLNRKAEARMRPRTCSQCDAAMAMQARQCLMCDAPFQCLATSHRRYCDEHRGCYNQGRMRNCCVCGKKCTSMAKQHVYCSRECRDADPTRRSRAATLRKIYKSNRAKVVKRKVYERDKWTCQICKEKLNRDVHWNDPMAPSIDHVIPRAKGGSNHIDNLQAAHRKCNADKKAMITALF